MGSCPRTPIGTPLPGQEWGFLGGFLPKTGFPKTPRNWASPTRDPTSPKVGALKVWCLCSKSLGAVVTCRSRKTLGRGGFLGHPSLATPHTSANAVERYAGPLVDTWNRREFYEFLHHNMAHSRQYDLATSAPFFRTKRPHVGDMQRHRNRCHSEKTVWVAQQERVVTRTRH